VGVVLWAKTINQEGNMSLVEIHGRLANTTLIFCLIMAVWGFWRFFRHQGLGASFWGALVIAEILFLVQGGLGAYLWISGLRPLRGAIHILYGVVSVLAVPVVYTYTKGRQERPEMLMYAVAFLIMVGLVLRSMVTGG
jgi:heme A synthase